MSKPDTTIGRGYGAQPHGERREGYPSDQTTPAERQTCGRTTWRIRASGTASRDGLQRANDAASRPEKQDVQSLPCRPFFTRRGKIFNQINGLQVLYIVLSTKSVFKQNIGNNKHLVTKHLQVLLPAEPLL
jgi:hypothetical protein